MPNFGNLGNALLVLALVGSIPFVAQADRVGGETGPAANELTEGLARFLLGLDADQKQIALYDFDDDERLDLRLAPLGLEGLRLQEMTDDQWTQLENLLGGVLSSSGLSKMNTIRSLEYEVAETEGGLFGFFAKRLRSARRYYLAVFGEPKSDSAWGMRFDGHHLSLNWTAVPGEPLSVTPVFWGGQPRVVPKEFERAGLRVLAAEEDRAMAFVNGLTSSERTTALIEFSHGGAIRRPMSISGEVPLALDEPMGLLRSALSPIFRKRLDEVIDVQLDNFVDPIAERYRERISRDAESIRFAYGVPEGDVISALESGQPFYYRIQGESFLIEYDNTSAEADHIHVVWREVGGDFGADLLAEHLAAHHGGDAARSR